MKQISQLKQRLGKARTQMNNLSKQTDILKQQFEAITKSVTDKGKCMKKRKLKFC